MYMVDRGMARAEVLLGGPDPIGNVNVPNFTLDGRHVVFSYRNPAGESGIYSMAVDGTGDPIPLITGDPPPDVPRISPDGRWLAYMEGPDTMVQPFSLDTDRTGERLLIPNARVPLWSFDSSELFYLQPGTLHIMGVRVTADPDLTLSVPTKLVDFQAMDVALSGDSFSVQVLPDGRFVYVGDPEGGTDPHLHVVLNFDTELSAKVPVAAAR